MIHVIDKYYIDVEDTCYTVGRKSIAMRNGEETEVFKPMHYWGTLKMAVKDISELYRKDKLSESDVSLVEAIKIIQKADNVLENVLYRALGDK
jgi:hypothetical protein